MKKNKRVFEQLRNNLSRWDILHFPHQTILNAKNVYFLKKKKKKNLDNKTFGMV